MRKPVQANMNEGVSGSIVLLIFAGILMSSVMQGRNWWLFFVFASGKWSFLIPSLSPFPSSSHIGLPSFAFRHSGNALTAAGKLQCCQLCRAPCPTVSFSPPIPLSWVLPGSAKQNRVFTYPLLSASLVPNVFSFLEMQLTLWFHFLVAWA